MIHKSLLCLPLLISGAFTTCLSASVYTSQIAEFNGFFLDPSDPSFTYPQASATLGTFTFSIPAGQAVIAATVFGTFGNLDSENTTALSSYSVNGITVANCASTTDPCFANDISLPPVAWSYTFTRAQLAALAGNTASFSVVQNGPFSIQTGVTELDLTTAPEPGTLVLFTIAGLALLVVRRQRISL